MNKFIQKLKIPLGLINGITFFLFILCISISLPTFSMSFYKNSYNKYNTLDRVHVSQDDLITVTKHLLDYMKDDQSDLVIEVPIDSEPREFFNDLEKAHMIDVKFLFDILFFVRNLSFFAFFVTFFLLLNNKNIIARCNQIISIIILILLILLIFLISLNFNKAFTIFHKIFFRNDLWILDPSTDLLINLVPLGFFIDISILVSVIFLIGMLLNIIISTIYLKINKV